MNNSDGVLGMVAAAVVRHALTAACVWLVGQGLLDKGQTDAFMQIATGIALGGIGLAWTWWQKIGYARLKARLHLTVEKAGELKDAVVQAQAVTQASGATPEVKQAQADVVQAAKEVVQAALPAGNTAPKSP